MGRLRRFLRIKELGEVPEAQDSRVSGIEVSPRARRTAMLFDTLSPADQDEVGALVCTLVADSYGLESNWFAQH